MQIIQILEYPWQNTTSGAQKMCFRLLNGALAAATRKG